MRENGAEGAAYEAYLMVNGPLMEHLGKYYDKYYREHWRIQLLCLAWSEAGSGGYCPFAIGRGLHY